MKNKKGNVAVIAIIIVIVAITAGAIGYLFAMTRTQAPVQQTATTQPTTPVAQTQPVVQSTTPTTQPAAQNTSVDETLNWQTYTNSKMGYTLKYPLEYVPNPPVDQYGAENVSFINKDGATFNVTVDYDLNGGIGLATDPTPDKDSIISGPSDIKISGVVAKEYKIKNSDNTTADYVFVSSNNKMYIVDNKGYNSNDVIFNKIISSFKFTK
ncbi:MAG: hypothetical protein PHW24_03660 [Candidatus Moranbacteria bacterium]|nr:hypothetical protein [Candidatus Moranbacteria bacterium]